MRTPKSSRSWRLAAGDRIAVIKLAALGLASITAIFVLLSNLNRPPLPNFEGRTAEELLGASVAVSELRHVLEQTKSPPLAIDWREEGIVVVAEEQIVSSLRDTLQGDGVDRPLTIRPEEDTLR